MNWLKTTGWKMIAGFVIMGIGGVLFSVGEKELGGIVISAGFSVTGFGVAHKAERAVQALEKAETK